MRWHLKGTMGNVFLIPSALLVVSASASYAQSSGSFLLSERPDNLLAQVKNKQIASNQESLSNTELVNALVLLELTDNLLAQAENQSDNPNQERFLQPATIPEPLPPENQEIVPSEAVPETFLTLVDD